jgi:hypothetical protein
MWDLVLRDASIRRIVFACEIARIADGFREAEMRTIKNRTVRL